MIIRALCLFVLSLLCGCSSIPAGREPFAAVQVEAPLELSLVLTPPRLEHSDLEQSKGYLPSEVLDARDLSVELRDWLRASRLFRQVRVTQAEGAELVAESWREGDDLRLELELVRVQTAFDGHNGWWIPNILNWAFWMVPAWFVATEEYSLEFEARARVWSVGSEQLLHEVTLPVRVEGTFDEFDRGWQVLGFLHPFNDADNWRQISAKLLPAARSALGEALARELGGPFHARARTPELRERSSKTLALVVGASSYHDSVSCPPLPSAERDARQVGAALVEANGLAAQHLSMLTGLDASRQGLSRSLAELRRHAREGDQVLIYLACYGARTKAGDPALLLYDGAGEAALTLEALASELSTIAGEKLVLLDTSFGHDARGLASEELARLPLSLDALTSQPRVSVVLAAGAGSSFHAPSHLGGSLFGHHLAAGLRGAVDPDGDHRLSLGELAAGLEERTVADSSFFGPPQRPLIHLGAQRFVLTLPAAEESRDPDAAK